MADLCVLVVHLSLQHPPPTSVLNWKFSKHLFFLISMEFSLETVVLRVFFPCWRLNTEGWIRVPFCALKTWVIRAADSKGSWLGFWLFVLRDSICALSSLFFVLCLIKSRLFFSIFGHQIGLAEKGFSHLGQRFCFWGTSCEHEPRQRQLKAFLIDLLIDFLPVWSLSLPRSCSQPDSLPPALSRTHTHAHAQVSLSRRHKWKVPFFWIEKKNKGGEDRGGLPPRPCFTFRRFAARSEVNVGANLVGVLTRARRLTGNRQHSTYSDSKAPI